MPSTPMGPELVAQAERLRNAQREEERLSLETTRMDLENRGRVVLMALGIVGVVVPLLAERHMSAAPSLLAWASVCLLVSALTGVVSQAVERHFRNKAMALNAQFISAVLLAPYEKDGRERADRLVPHITRLSEQRSRAGDIGDAVLYLSFVAGVCLLIAAVLYART